MPVDSSKMVISHGQTSPPGAFPLDPKLFSIRGFGGRPGPMWQRHLAQPRRPKKGYQSLIFVYIYINNYKYIYIYIYIIIYIYSKLKSDHFDGMLEPGTIWNQWIPMTTCDLNFNDSGGKTKPSPRCSKSLKSCFKFRIRLSWSHATYFRRSQWKLSPNFFFASKPGPRPREGKHAHHGAKQNVTLQPAKFLDFFRIGPTSTFHSGHGLGFCPRQW